MKKVCLLFAALLCIHLPASGQAGMEYEKTKLTDSAEKMTAGKFEPTWNSLSQYQCPAWFRNAKFGIWAHWGPQCQPERGDWYARHMYSQGHWQYNEHLKLYGHPSEFGFKDVINQWKAEKWDPESMIKLYKKAGAKYFFAMANHHDNFDCYDSSYQPWNSINMGPKRDIVGEWKKYASMYELRFGISVHAAHAWTWYETSQWSDKTGDKAGIPYDGNLTKADGKGKWWEGYDPQDLYAQNHALSSEAGDLGKIHRQWHWTSDESWCRPSDKYIETFYNRTMELINKYQPDELYFDDTVLPLYPISDVGLKIAAHYYNSSIKWHNGENQAVLCGKILNEQQKQALMWDIEKGITDKIEDLPWQTCTCIGAWHYDRGIYDNHRYKKPKQVVHMLVDIVSKNGNLLLNIPVRGDGSLDSDCIEFLETFAKWMNVNSEGIYDTRPWKIFGEGPAQESAAKLTAQGFNEGKGKPFTQQDIRFTTKNNDLYAFVMSVPQTSIEIRALSCGSDLIDREIKDITLLGSSEKINFKQTKEFLEIDKSEDYPSEYAVCYKITFR